MAENLEFICALDDSGGVEPLLNKHRAFFPGDHPFFIICSVILNTRYRDEFNERWTALRSKMGTNLQVDYLPPLHARLMFGKTKPEKYRDKPNPYLNASDEQVIEWYLEALSIFADYTRKDRGAAFYTVEYNRKEVAAHWEEIFSMEKALAEGEYLKVAHRQRYPRLHQKYIAHVSAALTMPTLDTFILIEGTMRQLGAKAHILLDSYHDADGFNEEAAFNFLNKHLQLSNIASAHSIPDTDSEPLCQAADLLAYLSFRSALFEARQKAGKAPQPDVWAKQAVAVLQGGRKLCSMDMVGWTQRQKSQIGHRLIFNSARYALAYHEIRKYAPDVVDANFLTPEEFLAQTRALPEAEIRAPVPKFYLPILKPGVQEKWAAARLNGEDRSESGPVKSLYAPAETRSTEDA